jgi:maltose-binding protein MalE
LKQLEEWMKDAFQKFIETHGPFKTLADGCLKLDDFYVIYQVIESYVRVILRDDRQKSEQARSKLFKDCFLAEKTKDQKVKLEEYVDNLLTVHIPHEEDTYAKMPEKLL